MSISPLKQAKILKHSYQGYLPGVILYTAVAQPDSNTLASPACVQRLCGSAHNAFRVPLRRTQIPLRSQGHKQSLTPEGQPKASTCTASNSSF